MMIGIVKVCRFMKSLFGLQEKDLSMTMMNHKESLVNDTIGHLTGSNLQSFFDASDVKKWLIKNGYKDKEELDVLITSVLGMEQALERIMDKIKDNAVLLVKSEA